MKVLPEIIKPADIQDKKKYRDIEVVELSSVPQLLELAETLEIPIIFQASRRKYMFIYEDMKFIAKQ